MVRLWVVVPVGVVQVPAVGVVRFRYQPPVWPVRVRVALLWVTELAVKGSFVVVNVALSMLVVQAESE